MYVEWGRVETPDSWSSTLSTTSVCLLIGCYFQVEVESIFCFQVSFSHSFFCAVGFWNSMHDLGFSSFGFHLIHFIQSVKIITSLDLVMHCCDRFSQPCAGTSSSSGCFSFCAPCQYIPLEAWQRTHCLQPDSPWASFSPHPSAWLLPSTVGLSPPICLSSCLLGAPQIHFRSCSQYEI